MMSATPSKEVIDHFQGDNKDILRLEVRFHRHPLPIPKIVKRNKLFQYIFLIKKIKEYKNKNKPVFIFAPTISLCEKIYRVISLFIKGGNYVHSKRKFRTEIIDEFRNNLYSYLVTTSVLERGVTVKDLQVIICQSDHKIYEKGVLIQIAGRVGRKKDAPEGEVIYLCEKVTQEMQESINTISKNNEALLDG